MALVPSSRYPGQTISGDAGYPLGKARNVTVSGDGTGTPFEEDLVNDIFGMQQAILFEGGFTSLTLVPDEVGASDYVKALHNIMTQHSHAQGIAHHAGRTAGSSYAAQFDDAGWTGDKWVICGQSGEIQTSVDGASSWTRRKTGGARLRAVYTSASLCVAVGDSGNIWTSPDGVTWTQRTPDSGFSGEFYAIDRSAGGLFVAVGASGTIQTSPDGVTWTTRTAAGGYVGNFNSLVCSGGVTWIAGGSGGMIQTSTNGTSWTVRTPDNGYTGTFYGAAASASMRVLVGSSGEIQWSSDFVTWTKVSPAAGYTADIFEVIWTGAIFLALGNTGMMQWSGDGKIWRSLTRVAYTNFFNGAGVGDGSVIMVGTTGGVIRQSLVILG